MTQTKRGLRTIQSKKLHSAGVQVIEGTRRWVCLTHVAAVAGGQDDSFGSSTHMMPLGTVTSLLEKPARAADSFYSIPMWPLFLRKRGVHVGGACVLGTDALEPNVCADLFPLRDLRTYMSLFASR